MQKFKIIVLLFFFFALGTFLGGTAKYFNVLWVADRNVNEYISFFTPESIDDNYGGSTPEETFDLYLSALRKGDLELASKYFLQKWQDYELTKLLNIQKEEKLNNYIQELEDVKNRWKIKQDIFFDWKSNAAFEYEYENLEDREIILPSLIEPNRFVKEILKAGIYTGEIRFEKLINIWKLQQL